MKYTVKVSGKFKKSYKLAQKRGLNVNLLEDDILTLTLIDTGIHADLFKM